MNFDDISKALEQSSQGAPSAGQSADQPDAETGLADLLGALGGQGGADLAGLLGGSGQ